METSEQRLWRAAKERLVSDARTLSPEAERLLGELIDKAATTVSSASASPEDVERAAASLESLITAAVQSTEQDCPNCREVEIPEKSMRTALSRVCPLFPFC